MIDRSPSENDNASCAVTFTVAADGYDGRPITVVGEFNGWDPDAAPLCLRNGSLSVTLTVEMGRRYRFRYLTDQGQWFNDHGADDYEPNEFGGEDGILDLASTRVSA